MKIGIFYLATGEYIRYWADFYKSAQTYFCPNIIKKYFVFTDDIATFSTTDENINVIKIEDRGWILNVLRKYELIISINKFEMKECEYFFVLNANYIFLSEMNIEDLFDNTNMINNDLTVLSYRHYQKSNNLYYPYDRNENSSAYIPFGQGDYYYQAGFYGGKINTLLEMANWCKKAIDLDLDKRIIALWHDESYLNKYLLDKYPYILDESFAYSSHIRKQPAIMRGIFKNKNKTMGEMNFQRAKGNFINGNLAYLNTLVALLDENKHIPKIRIVKLFGDAWQQIFQLSFFLNIKKKKDKNTLYYIDFQENDNNNFKITDILEEIKPFLIPKDMKIKIDKVSDYCKYTYIEDKKNKLSSVEFKPKIC